MEENKLLIRFNDQSENFVLGFEAGQIYQKMLNSEKIEGYIVHTKNYLQIIEIVNTFGCNTDFVAHGDDFMLLTVHKNEIEKLLEQ